jgi:hypothetical protein
LVSSIEDYWHVRRGAPFDTCFALSASTCIVTSLSLYIDTIGLVCLRIRFARCQKSEDVFRLGFFIQFVTMLNIEKTIRNIIFRCAI